MWVRLARRAAFLRRAARAYDVFHFNFGQTLLSVRQLSVSFDEIALLKRLGKTVLVTYQGCDVRPKAECPCRRPSCSPTIDTGSQLRLVCYATLTRSSTSTPICVGGFLELNFSHTQASTFMRLRHDR